MYHELFNKTMEFAYQSTKGIMQDMFSKCTSADAWDAQCGVGLGGGSVGTVHELQAHWYDGDLGWGKRSVGDGGF